MFKFNCSMCGEPHASPMEASHNCLVFVVGTNPPERKEFIVCYKKDCKEAFSKEISIKNKYNDR
jgi:hypothetical protein